MSYFLTRVELHNATYSDYETLHNEMAKQGFKRTIPADNGVKYSLPTAEYYFEGNYTAQDVNNLAKAAATKTNKNFGAITVLWTSASWYNLPTA